MQPKAKINHVYTILLFTFLPLVFSTDTDTLTLTQSLTHNNTLLSSSQIFELGFFNPQNSENWYVGIWYKAITDRTVVWVANRDTPLPNSSATLKISDNKIILVDQEEKVIWYSNITEPTVLTDPILRLLDTGNLVLSDGKNENQIVWQSFDYPTDTLLPDMKLGSNLKQGIDRYIRSWKNIKDPSSGDYSFRLDHRGFPEIFLWNNEVKRYRSGAWNGERFSGVPEMKPLDYMSFDFVTNREEVYYSFHIATHSMFSRLTISPSGLLQRLTWVPDNQIWSSFWYAPKDQCDNYRECGAYGICDSNASPVCKCMRGFEPRNQQAWNLRDGSGGCIRKTELQCNSDKFLHMRNMKLPDSTTSFVDRTMSIKDCELLCLRNCSCTAYSNANITNGGSGCVIWFDQLLDMRQYAEGGQNLFVRLAASDIGSGGRMGKIVMGVGFGGGILIVIGVCGWLVWKRKSLLTACACIGRRRTEQKEKKTAPPEKSQDLLLNEMVISSKREFSGEKDSEELELPLFDFATVATATLHFSDDTKLGQGGFGCVYKGRLVEGQEVAVKRLSKNSGQGMEEFKNEVRLIARLQHRNLVRLLGCCIDAEEKMLIYEYMQNTSLDSLLFNKARSSLLDWQRRFSIICGIARGLLYLHQDSRFRIIHRDLKASNILLDGDWTPKISDFGMARIFGGNQTEASTRRVVGTYGYMSPEYAMDGLFSVKSDVFSFGVLVLEIVSGQKNRGFYHSNSQLNLLGHAWRLWKDKKELELLDETAGSSFSSCEVSRSVQVGLLCVQERAEDRPTMSSVVLMLSSETATMLQPKTPGFCLGRSPFETDSSSGNRQDETFTVNQVTVTALDAR